MKLRTEKDVTITEDLLDFMERLGQCEPTKVACSSSPLRMIHQGLDNVSLPSGLQHLTFGAGCNQSLDNASLPNGLQILSCGDVDWTSPSHRPAVLDVASHECPKANFGVRRWVSESRLV